MFGFVWTALTTLDPYSDTLITTLRIKLGFIGFDDLSEEIKKGIAAVGFSASGSLRPSAVKGL